MIDCKWYSSLDSLSSQRTNGQAICYLETFCWLKTTVVNHIKDLAVCSTDFSFSRQVVDEESFRKGFAYDYKRNAMLFKKKSLHQHCVQQAFNMGINGCLVQWVKAKERLVVDNCTCSQNWKCALCDLSEQCTFCLIFQVIYSLSLWNLTSLYLSLVFLGRSSDSRGWGISNVPLEGRRNKNPCVSWRLEWVNYRLTREVFFWLEYS